MSEAETEIRPERAWRLPAAAAGLAALGVLLGAFGAHALKSQLAASSTTETWATAVHYHQLHAAAAFLLSFICSGFFTTNARDTARLGRRVAVLWLLGILFFSGSLYALALGAPAIPFGPITPLGGLLFAAGWLYLVIGLWNCR